MSDTPKKSTRFGEPSIYWKGIHYFPNDIKENSNPARIEPYTIQAVYFSGKWTQDTIYISIEFKNFITTPTV